MNRRWLPGSITLLTAIVLLTLTFVPSASASINFVTAWGPPPGDGDGHFSLPLGLATDSSGNVYVVDSGNSRIQKFDSSGNVNTFLRTWGWGVDDGSSSFQTCTSSCQAGTSGPGDGQFFSPVGVAIDSSGNVYVADTFNYRIQRFSSSGAFLGKWGISGALEGRFNLARDVATDSSGNVYVADSNYNRIQKFDSSANGNTFLRMWGRGVDDGSPTFQTCTSSCQGGSSGTGDGQLDNPVGLATDSSGNLYVADSGNDRIQKFDSSGTFLRTWGWGVDDGSSSFQTCTSSCQAGSSGTGDGQFASPDDVAVDSSGNVYVTDSGNNRIQMFSSSGAFLTKWGSSGSGNGQFDSPVGVAADSTGNIYVADRDNQRIQKFHNEPEPPETQIDSGPSGTTNDPTPTFTFSSSEPGSGFQCKVDSGSYAACSSPKTTSHLADGPHTFYVRATKDSVTDPTPDQRTFTVAAEPPQTTITSGPSGATNDPTPTFGFASSKPGSGFQCKVDSGSYAACSSPKTTSHLADGPHTFYVRATKNGITDPTPAQRAFTVDTQVPVTTASVSVQDSALLIAAAPGAKDSLAVTRPSFYNVRVTDFPSGDYTGSGVDAGPGCTQSGPYTANCPASGITPVLPVLVTAADQTDKVVNSSGLPSSLYGGGGDDLLIGGSADDVLKGGPGADDLQGMEGNDLLRAQDGTSDQAIDCGAGGDSADLDLLPLDPNSAVKGCETKTRH